MYIGTHVLPRKSQLFLSLVKASVSTGTTNTEEYKLWGPYSFERLKYRIMLKE
jgi:hypothetical protein